MVCLITVAVFLPGINGISDKRKNYGKIFHLSTKCDIIRQKLEIFVEYGGIIVKQVFVSYAGTDRGVAFDIVNFLENESISCFIAPRDIDGGKAYASALMKGLDDCDMVLLVASEAINHSEHVLNEVDVIVEKNKPILPVFIEDFELKDDFRYYLGRKHWIISYPDTLSSYFPKIRDAVINYLPKHTFVSDNIDIETHDNGGKTTVFEYNPQRGIMINPEDHQRNVSFRTDTFVNMMGGIYEKVEGLVGTEEVQNIFFESGYLSGKNFAERINNQWDDGYTAAGLKTKLEKWCRFDSAVGWGKFDIDVNIDEKNDTITGKVYINEAFIVDTRKKRKICCFIKGYCTGVLEILLDSQVDLVCSDCRLNSRLNTKCVFDIIVE